MAVERGLFFCNAKDTGFLPADDEDFYRRRTDAKHNIRGTLETKFGAVWVQGEISNYKQHASGHRYFTLKDHRAQISCVIWRDAMLPLRQAMADGVEVQVYGTVTVFEARGQYQLNVQVLQPRGIGLL